MMTKRLSIGTAIAVVLLATAAQGDPVQWSENGHFYEVVSESRTWGSARLEAAAMYWGDYKGHLATVTSAEEQAFLEATFGEPFSMAYLGGHQSPNNAPPADKWHWLTGEPWDYTHWAPGEPNDFGGAEYWLNTQPENALYWWNDWGPDDGNLPRFVVEYEPVPSPILSGPVFNPANGHSYYLTAEMPWQDAQDLALTLEGNLVTINDAAEQDWVFSSFSSFGGRFRSLWLGLTDQEVEGEFVWVSGESLTYTNWLGVQPDNAYGTEHYVHMVRPQDGSPSVGGTWNDLASPITPFPNFDPLHGVVEVPFEVVPVEPTTWGRLKARFGDD
jgi:hypothetical protein